jgi:hypothetical protein
MIPTLTINDELMTFSEFFFAFEGVVRFIIQKYAFQSKNIIWPYAVNPNEKRDSIFNFMKSILYG